MALSTMLRKSHLIKDLCIKPLSRTCTWSASSTKLKSWTNANINLVENLNLGQKRTVLIKPPSQFLQQIKKFSTSKQLMAGHGGDHSTMWTVEKIVTLALMGLIPACIAMPNKILDAVTAVFVTMHMHWGLHAIASDYIRKAVFGPAIPKVASMLVYILSIVTLAGLLNLTFNQAGIGNSIQLFWRLS